MPLHESTFEYLKPTEDQSTTMSELRQAAKDYAAALESLLPAGPDKDFIMRNHRTNAMWANVSVTRNHNGEPWQRPE